MIKIIQVTENMKILLTVVLGKFLHYNLSVKMLKIFKIKI